MSNFFQISAKSYGDWNISNLLAFNICISPVPPDNFFHNGSDPSLDHLDPAILNASLDEDDSNFSEAVADYLGYLDFAGAQFTQAGFVSNFGAETLKLLGFNERKTTILTHYTIPLTVCGDSKQVELDACLLSRTNLVLLVLIEDKYQINLDVQVVAAAVATFQFNNTIRGMNGLSALDAMTIPFITMTGTRPTFYLVPVTQDVSDTIIVGSRHLPPEHPTEIFKCVTRRMHSWTTSEGMDNIEYRKLAFKRLLAFKTLAKSHWETFYR